MNTVKHTPGPWIATNKWGRKYSITSNNAEISEVRLQATTEVISGANEQAEANAKLIAAAPELLSVLAECLGYLPTNHPIQKKAIKAIKKATE